MASVIDYYGDNQDVIIANAGPGHWNDPDMVRFPVYVLEALFEMFSVKITNTNFLLLYFFDNFLYYQEMFH